MYVFGGFDRTGEEITLVDSISTECFRCHLNFPTSPQIPTLSKGKKRKKDVKSYLATLETTKAMYAKKVHIWSREVRHKMAKIQKELDNLKGHLNKLKAPAEIRSIQNGERKIP